jgi:DNA-binding PadR family transcriptional regulator
MHSTTFLLLTALAGERRHGYAVMREVADLSAGRVRLRPGTLHAALDGLVAAGLVDVDREEADAGRLRRYYRLTGAGASALASARAAVPARRFGLRRAGAAA